MVNLYLFYELQADKTVIYCMRLCNTLKLTSLHVSVVLGGYYHVNINRIIWPVF